MSDKEVMDVKDTDVGSSSDTAAPINHVDNGLNSSSSEMPTPRASNAHTHDKIYITGDQDQYIHIGRQKFLRQDLLEAFGGTLQPGLAPEPSHKFANPAPLGLSAFALTTFVLSMFNAGAQGIEIPNVVVGLAMFYGGLVQLLAGMWEIALENTFGGTALASYGAFWLSFGAIYIPWFGVLAAYEKKESDLANALGFYLLGWTLFTLGMCCCTVKSTVLFFSLFFFLFITFLLLTIAEFSGKTGVKTAAGVFGVITAFIAWYNAFAGVATRQNSYIVAKPFNLPSNERILFQ